jgi:hypothetical protein
MSAKWSLSSTNTFRICQKKFFFSHVLAKNNKLSSLIEKQAYWLKKVVNLDMWAGNVVDTIMNEKVIPLFSAGEEPNFDEIEDYAIKLLRRQWDFSKEGKYKSITEANAKEDYCVLDVNENNIPYTKEELGAVALRVKQSIQNISKIECPNGQLLTSLLRDAKWLSPNLNNRSVKIGNTNVAPQIDLLLSNAGFQYIIDWKVSDGKNSDYARQLGIIGMVIYRKRAELVRQKEGNDWMYDFKDMNLILYEVNLFKGYIKEHFFTKAMYGELVDYVSQTSRDFELLRKGRELNEVHFKEYAGTGSDDYYTCDTCSFQHLCNFLIEHSNEYFTPENYREFIRAAKLV